MFRPGVTKVGRVWAKFGRVLPILGKLGRHGNICDGARPAFGQSWLKPKTVRMSSGSIRPHFDCVRPSSASVQPIWGSVRPNCGSARPNRNPVRATMDLNRSEPRLGPRSTRKASICADMDVATARPACELAAGDVAGQVSADASSAIPRTGSRSAAGTPRVEVGIGRGWARHAPRPLRPRAAPVAGSARPPPALRPRRVKQAQLRRRCRLLLRLKSERPLLTSPAAPPDPPLTAGYQRCPSEHPCSNRSLRNARMSVHVHMNAC